MINRIKNIISYIYPFSVVQCKGNVSPHLEINFINGKYTLDTYTVNYSYGGLQTAFDNTFNKFNLKERNVKDVLILGFGTGSVAYLLKEKYNLECNIVGVEMDQVVIDLAYKYFNIKRFKNLELVCDDAFKFVQTCKKKFDVIIVDIFIDDSVPKRFHEKEFLKYLDGLLLNKGILFFNKIANNPIRKNELDELIKNTNEIFGYSLIYKPIKYGANNYMIVHDRKIIYCC